MSPTVSRPFEFKIDIYTDTVCPFSYLGFLTLSRAISSFSSPTPVSFNLTYHPYILYPTARPSSRNLGAALTYIYSSHSQTTSILTHLDNLAEGYGVKFNWEGLTGNSRDSHRLVLLSQLRSPREQPQQQQFGEQAPRRQSERQQQQQSKSGREQHQRFMERLYKTGFEEGKDISNRITLAKLGVETGLFGSEQEGLKWLESGQLGPEVDKECERAKQETGVRAVPSYIVNNKWVVGGMQDQSIWEALFTKIIAKKTCTNEESAATSTSTTSTKETPREEEMELGSDDAGKTGDASHGRNCKVIAEG